MELIYYCKKIFNNLLSLSNCKISFKFISTTNESYNRYHRILPFTEKEKILINNTITSLLNDRSWTTTLTQNGIPSFFVRNSEFRKNLIEYLDKSNDAKSYMRDNIVSLLNYNVKNEFDSDCIPSKLVNYIHSFVMDNMPNLVIAYHNVKHLADFSFMQSECSNNPIKRKVYLHLGPPNSGKTHDSISRLSKAPTGIYCSPLRLLAWEMYNRLNSSNVPCSLLTGQENINNNENHISCTVEMVPFEKNYEVAVLDEMQMVGDLTRGHAWTRAFLGLKTQEIHVCGSLSCLTLARKLADARGDWLEVTEHTRLGNLKVMDKPVSVEELEPGDCVVCFSRNEAYSLRDQIESNLKLEELFKEHFKSIGLDEIRGDEQKGEIIGTGDNKEKGKGNIKNNSNINSNINSKDNNKEGNKDKINKENRTPITSIVYGSLPPQTRCDQIERFNKRETKILIASDVIGMGVNVSIKRIIFHKLVKYDGNSSRQLNASEVQQIAGRAGRYGLECGEGLVSCMRKKDIKVLRELMYEEIPQIDKAVISPNIEVFEAFGSALKQATGANHSLSDVTQLILSMAKTGKTFVMCDFSQVNSVAKCLEGILLPFDVYKHYLHVPMGSTLTSLVVRAFAISHLLFNSVKISNILSESSLDLNFEDMNKLDLSNEIKRLELFYETLDIYTWLSNKFPSVYVDKESVVDLKTRVSSLLSKLLNEIPKEYDNESSDIYLAKDIIRPEFLIPN